MLLAGSAARAQSAHIRLNQIGFYPNAPKIAVITTGNVQSFTLVNSTGKTKYTGRLVVSPTPSLAGKTVYLAYFSAFHQPGTYTLHLADGSASYPFRIAAQVHRGVAAGSIKAFYYQRASVALPERYAGQWHRAEGHPDNEVLIHPSAASSSRPEGTVIASPRGWYDAGDYNKYIVNSGITMGTMLSLYEDFPAHVKALKLNIPESNNAVPDLLDELLWNLRWMLTMQDPADGGVYHKLTNAAFDGMIMPDKATKPRYVVQKSTAATLDFAAVTAQAARIFKAYQQQLPGLADSCMWASELAWQWAVKNPKVLYRQEEMNQHFQPAVSTGTYGDNDVQDEWIWAACELYISTQQDQYLKAVNIIPDDQMPIPSWGQVRLLGYYSLLRNKNQLTAAGKAPVARLSKQLIALADGMVKHSKASAYQTVMGRSVKDFGWGSNSEAANQGIALLQAYRLTHQQTYLNAALSNLDYLLGRNGSGYAYVTGFGSKTPMHPHHRPSVADGVTAPIPGLLAGGPNPGMQDHIQVPSIVPDEAYIDDDRAYAVNEIAINWNAPLVYLANAIEALQQQWHHQ
ncbi:glycoside hydrolase family 9 protein [Mucilaginibacter koreensis]